MQSICERYIERREEGQDSIPTSRQLKRRTGRKREKYLAIVKKKLRPTPCFNRKYILYRKSNQYGIFDYYIADEMVEDSYRN